MTTVAGYYRKCVTALSAILRSGGEGAAAASIIFEDAAGMSRTYIFANGDRELGEYAQGKIDRAIAKVEAGEPVQYAVGKAQFMGNTYEVSPAVLIPRPETAGLVDRITDAFGSRRDLRVLDIGTGTGCIAISLARALPFAQVTGVDISDDALAIARRNAAALKANVDFEKLDILTATAPESARYDIIVSNPPYICRSEESEMEDRVLLHEPSQALFVPDNDPLLFYRAIAAYARKALSPDGGLFFEINSRFPSEMKALLESEGFADIDIARDYLGNYRYAIATQPLP